MTANPQNLAKAFEQIRADYDMSRQSRFVRRRLGVATQGSGSKRANQNRLLSATLTEFASYSIATTQSE
jgi:hypothetical protein